MTKEDRDIQRKLKVLRHVFIPNGTAISPIRFSPTQSWTALSSDHTKSD